MRRLSAVLLLTASAVLALEPTPLLPGQSVIRDISGFESHEFSIAMQDGQYAGLVLRHRGIDFTARLISPDGAVADFTVPQRPGDEESAGFVALTNGAYRIKIQAPYRGTAGSYEIRLQCL